MQTCVTIGSCSPISCRACSILCFIWLLLKFNGANQFSKFLLQYQEPHLGSLASVLDFEKLAYEYKLLNFFIFNCFYFLL